MTDRDGITVMAQVAMGEGIARRDDTMTLDFYKWSLEVKNRGRETRRTAERRESGLWSGFVEIKRHTVMDGC